MPRRHVAIAAAVAVIWGVNFVVIHVGLDSFPPLLFAALRFCLVALALPFVPRPGAPVRYVIAVGVFLSAGQFGLLFLGIDLGILPMGRFIGAELPRKGSIALILVVGFALGFATTIAEPDVLVRVRRHGGPDPLLREPLDGVLGPHPVHVQADQS